MVVIIVLSVAVWLSIPLAVSRPMAWRGFDDLSYLIVGVLSRPDVLVFAAVVVATAGVIGRQRLRQVHGLQSRLADAGDAWRALLLGAPPVLL